MPSQPHPTRSHGNRRGAHVPAQDRGAETAARPPHRAREPRPLRARGGRRPGCQGNGRTPGSSPHRLRPQKGRLQPRKAASREEEDEGLVKGGETRKKEEEEEQRKAARAIDGLLLRPGLVCLPRPSAPPGERGQTRQVTAGLGPALLYWSSCEVWGGEGDDLSFRLK